MAQIIKHRRGTLPQLQGVTLANGEIGIVSSSASNIGDSVLRTGLVIGNTDGTNRLTFARLPQGNSTPNLGGITGGSNFNDMLYHETDAKTLLVLHTSDNTNLDLTGNIANRTIGGTLTVNGNFEVTGSIIGTSTLNAASFGSTLAGLISGSFSSISSSLASRITVEETTADFTAAQISGSWRGELSSSNLTVVGGGVSGSLISTGSFGKVAGTLTTAAQPNITSVGTLADLEYASGQGDAITTDGFGDGTIDGFTIGGSEARPGTFTTLNASGDIRTSGNVIAQNLIVSSSVSHFTQSFSSGSTIFGDNSTDTHKVTGSLQISGGLSVDNGTIAGTISTTAQPNITHLSGLTTVTIEPVSGKSISTSTGFGGSATMDGFTIGGTTAAAGTFTTIIGTGLTVNGNATIGNSGDPGIHTIHGQIKGANLTKVSGSISSTGSFGRIDSPTSVNAASLGGTLTTAAQANITSVGTLTGLTVNNGGSSAAQIDISGVGATINGTTIGESITATGAFTSVTTSGNVSGSLVSTGSFGHGHINKRLGVGTESPSNLLTLSHHGYTGGAHIKLIDTQVNGKNLWINNGYYGAGKAGIYYDNAQMIMLDAATDNIGIGTSSPSASLHVVGNILGTGNISGSLTSTGSFGHLIIHTGTIDGGAF